MSYNNKILYFYEKGFFFNKLYSNNFNFCSYYLLGTLSCGDIFLFQLIISFFALKIFSFKFKIYGCGSAISSISLTSFYLFNKFYYQIIFLKDYYLSKKLNLPIIKFHCSVISQNILFLCFSFYKNNYIIFFF